MKPRNIMVVGKKGYGLSYRYRYDIEIDGYRIRNNADFNRVDMKKSERRKIHRKLKLEKKDTLREEVNNV